MAWMTKTTFVKGASTEALARACEALLADRELAKDSTGILGVPPPVRLSPQRDGWVAVNGLGAWLADPLAAAQRLSREGSSALSCELIGNSLRLRFAQYVAGEERHRLQSPKDLPWDALAEHGGPMPRYEDVEEKAFRTLRTLGVPSTLLGIGLSPLGAGEALDLGDGIELLARDSEAKGESRGDATRASFRGDHDGVASAGFEQRPCPHSAAPLDDDTPPALPREASRDFGVSLFDDRYVEGRPNDGAVERLLELEERWEARARVAVDEPEVSLTVTYHGGTYQEQLDELLRARGRYVPPTLRPTTPPWWAFWKYFGAGAFKRR